MKFNTAIAAMMALINEIDDAGCLTKQEMETFTLLLCPFAPHLAEEIWEGLGHTELCSLSVWPIWDEAKTVDATIEIAVQVLGKLRGTISVAADADKDTILAAAKEDARVKPHIEGKQIVKEIFVPGKLINIVVK